MSWHPKVPCPVIWTIFVPISSGRCWPCFSQGSKRSPSATVPVHSVSSGLLRLVAKREKIAACSKRGDGVGPVGRVRQS